MIFQGHMDMVCEKGAGLRQGHDPSRGWIWPSTGTLSLPRGPPWAATTASPWPWPWPCWTMRAPCPIRPIEAVITVDEETGMDGADGH